MFLLFFIVFFSIQPGINNYDSSGYTPLMLSVIDKDYNKTEELLKKGANPDIGRNTEKIYYKINQETLKTPLMYAATLGDFKTVKLLIKYGANVNKKNKKGLSALIFAIDRKHHDIVYYLYKKIKNKKAPEILAQAVKTGDLELTDFFIKKKIPLTYETQRDNILTLAIKSKNIDIIKKVLKNNKNLLNKPTKYGDYPVMIAITKGNYNIFMELLKYKNIDLSVKNKLNQTVLHIAAQRFKTDQIIKKLLDMKIDANITDIYGKTALFYLITRQNDSVIKYLIDKTDLTIRDKNNKTVYFYATANYNVFNLLVIKHRPQLKLKDNTGKSLLLYIIDRGDYRVLNIFRKELKLQKDYFKDQNLVSVAARRGNYDMVETLLQAGFDVNGTKYKMPPILKAVELNRVGILYLLLFYHADKNIYYHGRTTWSIAEQFRYVRALFLLRNFKFERK